MLKAFKNSLPHLIDLLGISYDVRRDHDHKLGAIKPLAGGLEQVTQDRDTAQKRNLGDRLALVLFE